MSVKVKEDIIPVEIKIPDYKKGGAEFRQKVLDYFNKHKDIISDVEIAEDLYPSRTDPIWYASSDDSGIWWCTYKGVLRISCYCYDDACVYLDDDDEEGCHNAEDLEEEGIYTDEELYDRTNDLADPWCDNYSYYTLWISPTENSGFHSDGASLYDLNYEEIYDLDGVVSDSLDWIFGKDGFVEDYIREYLMEDPADEALVKELKLLGDETVDEDISPEEIKAPDYKQGGEEWADSIRRTLMSYDKISDVKIRYEIYPLRDRCEWYPDCTILEFTYDNGLVFSFYVGGDVSIPAEPGPNPEVFLYGPEDFENAGIYTDEELQDHIDALESSGNYEIWDYNTPYINFCVSLVDDYSNDHNYQAFHHCSDCWGYDMSYEDCYQLSDYLSVDMLCKFIEEEIPYIIDRYGLVNNYALEMQRDEQDDEEDDGGETPVVIHEDITPEEYGVPEFSFEEMHAWGFRFGYYYSEKDIPALISNRGKDKVWEACCWDYTEAAHKVKHDGLTFEEAWEDAFSQISNPEWREIEIRFYSTAVIVYNREEADRRRRGYNDRHRNVQEDVNPIAVPIPSWDRKYKCGTFAPDYINAAYMDNVWEVCAWVYDKFTYSYHLDNVTFKEAYDDFLKQLGNKDYRVVELRYKKDKEICPVTVLMGHPGRISEAVREEAEEKKKLTKQEVLNDLINTFGYIKVSELTDAVYVLPNGKILDTKGPYENHQHENIAKYIEEKYKIKDVAGEAGSKFMNSIGATRVTPWIPGIIVSRIKLTKAQEDTLFSIIKGLSLKVKPDHPLMVLSEDGRQFVEYTKVKNPEEVITSILGYQILGILKEKLSPGKEFKFMKHLD